VILQNVAAVHSACGFHHTLCINSKYFDVKVKCPIAVIIGDPKGNNSLLTHYISLRSNSSVMSVTQCLMKQIIHILCIIVSLNREFRIRLWEVVGKELKASPSTTLGIHFWNHSFGANRYGIYQHCPPDKLHSIKEGLYKYLLKGLVDQLSGKQKALAELDSLFQEISKHCKYQSDSNFPHRSFPFGFSNSSKVTGDENEGLLIVMTLLMESVNGKRLKKANMSGVLFHCWVCLFQEVLLSEYQK
jgi:hypothetical protein